MEEFNSFKKLQDFLKQAVKKAIQDEPPKAIKNVLKKHILRDVYMAYEKPKKYVRRYHNDGLMDEDNIKVQFKRNNTIEVYNIAKRNLMYTNQYLTPVIEYGHEKAKELGYRGYTFPHPRYKYYHKRPFIANTRESLRKNKSHVKALQHSLRRLGINTEM